jgi:hypothetical protein
MEQLHPLKLANNSVTTLKIVDASVTSANFCAVLFNFITAKWNCWW